MCQAVDNVLEAKISEILGGNSEIERLYALQSAEKSAECLCALVFDVVEVEVQIEGLEIVSFDLINTVANGLRSDLSNVIEVEIQSKSMQVLLCFDSLCHYFCSLSSDLVGIQVEIKYLEIGPLQMRLEEAK